MEGAAIDYDLQPQTPKSNLLERMGDSGSAEDEIQDDCPEEKLIDDVYDVNSVKPNYEL